LQILFKRPTSAIVFATATKPSRFAYFRQGAESIGLATETTLEQPKVVRTYGTFSVFTSKCAARHNGVHFFIISTSKSDLRIVCFVHYDLEMCFAPQRPALFHLISPDGSAPATLASLLVDRPEPQIIGKTQCAATLLPFRAAASSVF
jgi:hypothetical protein